MRAQLEQGLENRLWQGDEGIWYFNNVFFSYMDGNWQGYLEDLRSEISAFVGTARYSLNQIQGADDTAAVKG